MLIEVFIISLARKKRKNVSYIRFSKPFPVYFWYLMGDRVHQYYFYGFAWKFYSSASNFTCRVSIVIGK